MATNESERLSPERVLNLLTRLRVALAAVAGDGDESWNYATGELSDLDLIDTVLVLGGIVVPHVGWLDEPDGLSVVVERFRTELAARLAARDPESVF